MKGSNLQSKLNGNYQSLSSTWDWYQVMKDKHFTKASPLISGETYALLRVLTLMNKINYQQIPEKMRVHF